MLCSIPSKNEYVPARNMPTLNSENLWQACFQSQTLECCLPVVCERNLCNHCTLESAPYNHTGTIASIVALCRSADTALGLPAVAPVRNSCPGLSFTLQCQVLPRQESTRKPTCQTFVRADLQSKACTPLKTPPFLPPSHPGSARSQTQLCAHRTGRQYPCQ